MLGFLSTTDRARKAQRRVEYSDMPVKYSAITQIISLAFASVIALEGHDIAIFNDDYVQKLFSRQQKYGKYLLNVKIDVSLTTSFSYHFSFVDQVFLQQRY